MLLVMQVVCIFESPEVPAIKKVIDIDKFKGRHCNTYQQKQEIADTYEIFFCDDRVRPPSLR